MALQRQLVPVPFARGEDTKTDPKQADPSSLIRLENGQFTKAGQLRKRPGASLQYGPLTVVGATRELDSFNEQPAVRDGLTVQVQSANGTFTTTPGAYEALDVSATFLPSSAPLAGPATQYAQLPAQASECIAGLNGTTVSIALRSLTTGQQTSIAGFSAAQFRLVAHIGAAMYVFVYEVSGSLYARALSSTGAFGSAVLLGTLRAPGAAFDIMYATAPGPRVYVAWDASGSPNVAMAYLTLVGAAITVAGTGTYAATFSNVGQFYICDRPYSAGFLVFMAPTAAGTTVQYFGEAYTLASQFKALTTLTASLTAGAPHTVAAAEPMVNGTAVVVLVSTTSTSTVSGILTKQFTLDSTNSLVVVSNNPVIAGLCLQSRVVQHPLIGALLVLLGPNKLPPYSGSPGAFQYQAKGVLARVQAQSPGAQTSATVKPVAYVRPGSFLSQGINPALSVLVVVNNALHFVVGEYFLTGNTSVTYSLGVTKLTHVFGSVAGTLDGDNAVMAAGALHWGGGLLWEYDGNDVFEHGFSFYPDYFTATPFTAGAAALGGTYVYQVYYEWVDAAGRVHRSAPSAPKSVTVTAPNDAVRLVLPVLPITAKGPWASNPVYLVIARSSPSGTTPYIFDRVALSDPTVDTITYNDQYPFLDIYLRGAPAIYTYGGVQNNDPVPPCKIATMYRGRMWVVNSESPLELWFSKPVLPAFGAAGTAVEFSAGQTIRVDQAHGPAVTGLGVLDDKLIVFKNGGVFYLVGDGPALDGTGLDYTMPALINANTGCVSPRSVLPADNGIMYQSRQGVFIIDRALQETYIGAGVEDELQTVSSYNKITAAQLVPGSTEALFVVPSTNAVLRYNWLFKQWSVDRSLTGTAFAPRDLAVMNNVVWELSQGLRLGALDGSSFTDFGGAEVSPVYLRATKGWISFAGVQGYQRVYKMLILGDYISAHTLKVSIYTDFNEAAPVQTVTLTPTGSGVYQFRVFMKQQKCQAVKVILEEQGSVGAEGLRLSGLVFEVGVLPNAERIAAAKSAG